MSISLSEKEEGRRRVLDDGTGAVFVELREKGKEKESILFGTPVKTRGNVVSWKSGYVLIAEKVEVKGEEFMVEEMKNFLCRYT